MSDARVDGSILLADDGWRVNRHDDDRFFVHDPQGRHVDTVVNVGMGARSDEEMSAWADRWWYEEGGREAVFQKVADRNTGRRHHE